MIEFDSMPGNEITSTIQSAIDAASQGNDLAHFEFNGVEITVAGDSKPDLIYRDWQRGMSGYLGKNAKVGPYPAAELTAEEKASDATIEEVKERERQAQQADYEKEAAKQRALLAGALMDAPKMEFTDYGAWCKGVENNRDEYGAAVYRYAEKWARLMQARIANGETVADCAKDMSRLADDEGITGFMYGAAVSILSAVWIHGEELRRWHNLGTQIGTEGEKANESGGVLNPAVLSVGD